MANEVLAVHEEQLIIPETFQNRWDEVEVMTRGGFPRVRPVALFWELLSQEELTAEEGLDVNEHLIHLVSVGNDILVFESRGRRTLLRHYIAEEACWKTQSMKMKSGSHIAVQAAVVSPVSPRVVYILHCSSDWNSDRRYDIYTFNADTYEIEPQTNQLDDVSIAPKKRHGFSIAPFSMADQNQLLLENGFKFESDWSDHRIYFMCGLQHFPGDTTGSFVYCFSPENKSWSQVDYTGHFPAQDIDTPYVGCRFGQSCVVYKEKAWFFGGCVKGDYGMEPTNDFFTFHLIDHHWEPVVASRGVQPPPLSGHVALVCHDHMLIFTNEAPSIEVYSFNLIASTWELLPEVMLGPQPADGRVYCCISGEKLIAYQQCQAEAAGATSQHRTHELFTLDVGETLHALRKNGSQGMVPRGRRELDLLGDEATADVEFTVEGRKVVAHKKILQRFSPTLSALCENSAMSPSVHAGERLMQPTRLDNVKYSAFCLMLEHIYSRFTKPLQPADAENLLELAQQFELIALVERCQDCVVIDASNVRRFLDLAQKVGMEVLNQKCITYLIAHPEHLSSMNKGRMKSFSGSGSVSPEVPPLAPPPIKWNPLEHTSVAVTRQNKGVLYQPPVPAVPTRAVVHQDPGQARQPDPSSSWQLDRSVLTAPLHKSIATPTNMHMPGLAPGQLAGPARNPAHKASPHIVQTPQWFNTPYYHMPLARVPPPQG